MPSYNNYNRYNRGRRGRSKPRPRLMPPPETKYFNNNIIHSAISSSTTSLTLIAAGTGVENRIGRKIKLKSLLMNIRKEGTGVVRAVLYVPKQANQTLSLPSLESPVDNDQFWVLRDWYFSDTNNNNPGVWTHVFPTGLNVEYEGTGSGAVVKNPVKLLLQTIGSSTINGHTKVWYTDN